MKGKDSARWGGGKPGRIEDLGLVIFDCRTDSARALLGGWNRQDAKVAKLEMFL